MLKGCPQLTPSAAAAQSQKQQPQQPQQLTGTYPLGASLCRGTLRTGLSRMISATSLSRAAGASGSARES